MVIVVSMDGNTMRYSGCVYDSDGVVLLPVKDVVGMNVAVL